MIHNYVDSAREPNVGDNPHSLTKREIEVLGFICKEHTNQEIAEKSHISIRTVDAHRRNLLQKTGARNTAGLVRYAIENNLFLITAAGIIPKECCRSNTFSFIFSVSI